MNPRCLNPFGKRRSYPSNRLARRQRACLAIESLERRIVLTVVTAPAQPLGIGINLDAISYISSDYMFSDVMKMTANAWDVTNAASVGFPFNDTSVPLPPMDANGYPIGLGNLPANGEVPFTYVFTNSIAEYPTGTYTLTFDGKGSVEIVDGVDKPQVFTQNGGLGTPSNVTVSADSGLGLLIAITSSDPTDYVKNIRLVMPGEQNTYQTQPFNPQYLNALQPFSYLRFVDAMQINSATQQVGMTWANETPITYRTQTKSTGISIQYMVDLCNTLNKDMWVNMPVGAASTYVSNFASYVAANLNPGLKVYVEYGGEVWNNGYADQYAYVSSYGKANNLTYPQATANLTADCWNIWRQVFAGQTDRMVRVVGSQFSWTGNLGPEIAQLVATSSPSDPDHGFDVVSGGSYFGVDTSSFDAQTTVQQIEAAETASLPGFAQVVQNYMDAVEGWEAQLNQHIPVIMYEGGLSLATGSPYVSWYDAFIGTQTDPGQGPITTAFLNDLAAAGVTGVNYYSFIRPADEFGEWGSMDYLGEPSSETPKYNALLAFANSPSLVLTGFPDADVAGDVENVTVIAYGPNGSGVNTGYTGTVKFSSSDSQASLPAAYTFTAADAGVHTFTIALNTSGVQSITVTDAANQLSKTQPNINIQPAPAASLRVTDSSPNLIAGAVNYFSVTAIDAYGNVATEYTGTVTFTSTDSSATLPASYTFTASNAGTQSFTATLNTAGTQTIYVTDTVTASITGSASANVSPGSPPTSVLSRDLTTQGNWQSLYGTQGYDIVSDAVSLPSGATVTPNGATTYTWTTTSSDTRALQTPGSSDRVAAVWDSFTSFTIAVNFNFVQAHDIALYALDWDNKGRIEQIQVSSAGTGAILDTETISNFSTGVYLQWNVTGNVIITVTRLAGLNAVVDGLFFGPPLPVTTTSAAFVGEDPATQGNWQSVYGAQGYDVVSGTDTLPSSVNVAFAGAATYTWTNASSDTRALQTSVSSNRVAAAWYASTSFTIAVNLYDGQAHDIALYALDFDSRGRSEQIQISSAGTGAILDTETISNFADGAYLQWDVTGNVIITVTPLAGPNAVINGLFVDPTATSAVASQLSVSASTAVTAGGPFSVTVTAETSRGAVVTGYMGTVEFTSSDSQAGLPASYTFVGPDDGKHTFSVTLKTAGAQYVNVADTSTSAISGSLAGIVVQASRPYPIAGRERVTRRRRHRGRQAATNFTVTAMDPYGNVATGYTGTIGFTSTDLSRPGRPAASQLHRSPSAMPAPTRLPQHWRPSARRRLMPPTPWCQASREAASATVSSVTAAATFVNQDATTQGNWQGVYGTQGYDIVSGAVSLPSYATVTSSGAATYTWTTTSADIRALQTPGSSNRVAAAWYASTSFTIAVNLTDGQAHDIALYALDWDNRGRREQIQISSAATGAILDTETISNFSGGVYLQWNVIGNVIITVKSLAGPNAIVDGLFVDPPTPVTTATAAFVDQDTATQGNWENHYGTQGYDIVSGAASLPSYVNVTSAGKSTYTWTTTSSDTRALQTPGSSNRVAAVWYASTSFTIAVNLLDGQAHDIALYALDYDSLGRSEQIQTSAAATGKGILDTETISNFSSGVYLQWKVTGNVITYDNTSHRPQRRCQWIVPGLCSILSGGKSVERQLPDGRDRGKPVQRHRHRRELAWRRRHRIHRHRRFHQQRLAGWAAGQLHFRRRR